MAQEREPKPEDIRSEDGEVSTSGPRSFAPADNCDEVLEAAIGANDLIERMQDVAFNQLKPENEKTDEQAFLEILEELDTATEIEPLRQIVEKPQAQARKRGDAEMNDAEPDVWTEGP